MTNCQICDIDKKCDEFPVKSKVGKYVYYKKTCKACIELQKNINKKVRIMGKFKDEHKTLIRNNIDLLQNKRNNMKFFTDCKLDKIMSITTFYTYKENGIFQEVARLPIVVAPVVVENKVELKLDEKSDAKVELKIDEKSKPVVTDYSDFNVDDELKKLTDKYSTNDLFKHYAIKLPTYDPILEGLGDEKSDAKVEEKIYNNNPNIFELVVEIARKKEMTAPEPTEYEPPAQFNDQGQQLTRAQIAAKDKIFCDEVLCDLY